MSTKCSICKINWHAITKVDGQYICALCSEKFKCKICQILLFPNITAVTCLDCWQKLGISKITDGIYISDFANARSYDKLKELGIRQILSIGAELTPHETKDFETHHIKLYDYPTENIYRYFNFASDFIKKQSTLVHCYAGISRSASLVIAHLIKEKNLTFEQALQMCQRGRAIVNPNIGFTNQLKTFETDKKSYSIIDEYDLTTETGSIKSE